MLPDEAPNFSRLFLTRHANYGLAYRFPATGILSIILQADCPTCP